MSHDLRHLLAARTDRRARAGSARRRAAATAPSTIISYGRRQACAHCPRLALRPPHASDEKHWPEYATHSAPWTKISSSQSVASRMARTSASDSSRASVTRLDAEALRQAHAIGAGHAHLRAAVDLQVGRDLLRHAHHADILNDERVRARLGDLGQRARRFVQLVVEDQRIERDVALDAAPVQGAP